MNNIESGFYKRAGATKNIMDFTTNAVKNAKNLVKGFKVPKLKDVSKKIRDKATLVKMPS